MKKSGLTDRMFDRIADAGLLMGIVLAGILIACAAVLMIWMVVRTVTGGW